MTQPHRKRREALRNLVTKKSGEAATAEWHTIDFAHSDARNRLQIQFAAAVASRAEGLVLKPTEDPYFPLEDGSASDRHGGFIKLKKDYMQSMGEDRDLADFAVVGASYDPQRDCLTIWSTTLL